MIALRIKAALLAIQAPHLVAIGLKHEERIDDFDELAAKCEALRLVGERNVEVYKTSVVAMVGSMMDAVIAHLHYRGDAEEDDWWEGYLGAYSDIRQEMEKLKPELMKQAMLAMDEVSLERD